MRRTEVAATLSSEVLHMSSGQLPYRLPAEKRRRFAVLPMTSLGKWAIGMAVAGAVLVLGWSTIGGLGGALGLVLGLAGGGAALTAIFRRGERAVTVFAAVLPFLTVVVFLLAELFIGHN